MQGSVRKAPFRCPSCGFVQNEPEHMMSTYCRSCGDHYQVSAQRMAVAGANPPVRAVKRAARPPRVVHCYRCQHTHEVSASAQTTMCPTCTTSIELRDLVFTSNVSRPVDTRGKLYVEKQAYLNSTYIVCGDGQIDGRINGTLFSEGELRLTTVGDLNCRITAKSVIVEKEANVVFHFPVTTDELVIYGKARGNFDCARTVRIYRLGQLEGTLTARSVIVDKGGILLASSSIKAAASASIKAPKGEPSRHETGGLGWPSPVRHLIAY